MTEFLEVFIPLFVTIDAFGLLPIYVGVTAHLPDTERRRIALEALGTAFVVAIGFMLLGQAIFRFMGIQEADFRIAGGAILLVWAIVDLLNTGKPSIHENEMVGVVPLAMPLISGPATLATTTVLAGKYGIGLTSVSLAVNFAILLVVLRLARPIARMVGTNSLRAFSKIVVVLLAALAVSYIASGISDRFGLNH